MRPRPETRRAVTRDDISTIIHIASIKRSLKMPTSHGQTQDSLTSHPPSSTTTNSLNEAFYCILLYITPPPPPILAICHHLSHQVSLLEHPPPSRSISPAHLCSCSYSCRPNSTKQPLPPPHPSNNIQPTQPSFLRNERNKAYYKPPPTHPLPASSPANNAQALCSKHQPASQPLVPRRRRRRRV